MRHSFAAAVVLCLLFTSLSLAQSSAIKPMHIPAGTVLTFYLQTRLNSNDANAVDLLPKGTQLSIKMLDSIDSATTRDGSEFHGIVTTHISSPDGVVIHADAEVKGLFVLLRSKNHPNGFRYELLITEITDGGKSFRLTASLNESFLDIAAQPANELNGPVGTATRASGERAPANR
jgi:hypothetical protein